MKQCRCCKNSWPLEFFRVARRRLDGTPIRRASCEACRLNCGAARRRRAIRITAEWQARLRADVMAVREARALSCAR